ncbi:1-phosphofructokinase [Sutcliffiella cohnii]|uniref:1-phosphofructokinase n=1 Tax=Sutcliffiella cohnii TaxID=33932 RepID=UPI002E2307B7|nr:1-phosphofructokinase [Sutcliffiella cohnii]MED4014912.1 1-phosphofructokinase [Sutcliffiella cohnii]
MIYTVTLNPSIDYVMSISSFQEGVVNRASQTMYYPGGKGLNVSRVLTKLGTSTTALGFVAGFTGNFIKEKLLEEQVNEKLIEVEGVSRINVKLKAKMESEINGTGPVVSENNIDLLIGQLQSLNEGDIVVLAGSIPNTMPSTIYETLMSVCAKNNVKVVLDTGGEMLTKLLDWKPFLIKPNHHELGDLFNVTIESTEEAIHFAQKVLEQGVENIIVSMAGDGAILATKQGTYFAKAPKGVVKNSVGAGDSLVAGFLAGYSKEKNILHALQNGIAAGSATAFSHDLCEKEEVERLLNEVVLQEVNLEDIKK